MHGHLCFVWAAMKGSEGGRKFSLEGNLEGNLMSLHWEAKTNVQCTCT